MGQVGGSDRLATYLGKRNRARTPEPMPDRVEPVDATRDPIFVVQEHHARRLHWDFRLEHDGVLVSWALPKGVPDDPASNGFAAHTEDHPLAYAEFAGSIPAGEYGAGEVIIVDRGSFEVVKWTDREVKVALSGRRWSGGYTLFRIGEENQWMIHREQVPIPESLRPMLAAAGPLPPDDGRWGFEMKWDGMRTLAFVDCGRLRLRSRTEHDVTDSYPELAGLVGALGKTQALLDGEIVVFDGAGRPSFEALQQRMNASARRAAGLAARVPVTYLVFDVLHLNGRPLFDLAYQERRAMLEALGLAGPHWATPPLFVNVRGVDVVAASKNQRLEGIVAKRLDSRYEPGRRSPHWRKIKNARRQELVVGGTSPGEGGRTGQIGSLLLGVYTDAGLVYAGRVGTGFSQQTLVMLADRLTPLRRVDCPFVTPVPRDHAAGVSWVEPRLVVEVAFTEWTSQGLLRHPSYQGLRTDKDPAEVVREPD